jgi:hypothetical protein
VPDRERAIAALGHARRVAADTDRTIAELYGLTEAEWRALRPPAI